MLLLPEYMEIENRGARAVWFPRGRHYGIISEEGRPELQIPGLVGLSIISEILAQEEHLTHINGYLAAHPEIPYTLPEFLARVESALDRSAEYTMNILINGGMIMPSGGSLIYETYQDVLDHTATDKQPILQTDIATSGLLRKKKIAFEKIYGLAFPEKRIDGHVQPLIIQARFGQRLSFTQEGKILSRQADQHHRPASQLLLNALAQHTIAIHREHDVFPLVSPRTIVRQTMYDYMLTDTPLLSR